MPRPLIIIGASARAAAQSAIRAGFEPWCIDLFADRDLAAIAPVTRCPMEQYPVLIPSLLRNAPAAPVLCTGSMENHLEVVETIAHARSMITSSPAAMRSVRDPGALASLPIVPGLKCCGVSCETAAAGKRYLVKPRRGGGGAGIRVWSAGEKTDAHHFLQEFIDGQSASAIYRAADSRAVLLGTTEQFIGDAAFGAHGFQYCGGVAPFPMPERATAALTHLGNALTQQHGLRSVFGVDFIFDEAGDVWPVEVNPRYTAGVELVERASGICALADQGAFVVSSRQPTFHAKAIVFAKHNCRVPDLHELFTPDEVADVPAADEFTPAGRPICTLFAAALARDAAVARLREQVGRLYTRLES